MRHSPSLLRAIVIAVAIVPACAAPNEPTLSTTDQALSANNGENLNGENLNGENLNGENLNGENLNGPNASLFTIYTSLEGVVMDGETLDYASLSGTVFTGYRGVDELTGEAIVGAEFVATKGDGNTVKLRIASVIPPTTGTAWSYVVEFDHYGSWIPICSNANGPLAAYAMEGIWDYRWGVSGGGSHIDDPTKFTFACREKGAIAKCVDDGYEPWSSFNGVSLAPYHQACVRMIRADYCGDGTSYTTNGRLVNLYDGLDIQVDTNNFGIEAEWTASGARCLTTHRRATIPVPCYDPALDVGCGSLEHFQSGTLIINEIP